MREEKRTEKKGARSHRPNSKSIREGVAFSYTSVYICQIELFSGGDLTGTHRQEETGRLQQDAHNPYFARWAPKLETADCCKCMRSGMRRSSLSCLVVISPRPPRARPCPPCDLHRGPAAARWQRGVGEIGVSTGDKERPPRACAPTLVTSPPRGGDIATGVPTCTIGLDGAQCCVTRHGRRGGRAGRFLFRSVPTPIADN